MTPTTKLEQHQQAMPEDGQTPGGSADNLGTLAQMANANKLLQEQIQQLTETVQFLEAQHPGNANNNPENLQEHQHDQHPEVNQIRNLKLPLFWKGNPALWFIQVEAAFSLSNITADTTRFRHVITQLDSQTLPAISDIILNPPANNKYQAIKDRIMSSFAETSESKLRQLLRGIDPRDEKPTLLLQRIRNLADGQVSDALLRTLFLEQLPEYVRGVLIISGDLDLSALARQADKVMEATSRNSVATVSAAVIKSESNNEIAAVSRDTTLVELANAVATLTKEIKSIKFSARQTRPRSHSRQRSPSATKSDLCFYHLKFGEDARRCQQPCAWHKNKQQGN